MAKRRWQARIGLVFLSLALVVILNPETRAALLIVDSIGLDVVILLVSMQLRLIAPSLSPMAAIIVSASATAGVYAYRSIAPLLLYVISPRLMPAPLVMLLFLCAATQLRMARRSTKRAYGR
jgi:hypothetical protein